MLQDFTFSFLAILLEGIPFLLLGSIISGAIEAYVPATWMTRIMPRNSIGAVFAAGLVGCVFPMCECGVVPVIRRLLGKGLPVACALTYMLASPIVNPIVAVSTFAAFQGNFPEVMTAGRLILGYLVAVLAGAVALRFAAEQLLRKEIIDLIKPRRKSTFGAGLAAESSSEALPEEKESFLTKLGVAVRGCATDFLDTMVYFVIGAALASLFNTAVPQTIIDPLATNEVAATLSMMVLAFIISICSTTDAFVAATMVKFPMAAKLAFLVFGPMMDIKLMFLYGVVLRRKVIFILAAGLFVVVAILCLQFGVAFAQPF